MPDMTGKTVLVTGASRGIGAASARVFAAAGANVALLARSGEAIGALAEEIGERALPLLCDVSSFEQVRAAVEATLAAFGRLDVLVNNAGVLEPIARMEDADPQAWGQVIDINLKGVFYAMQAAYPAMLAQGGGTILTLSSGAAHSALEGWSAYCASKAGAAMLTMCADREWRGKGVRVMGLSPGTVATDMQARIRASGINPVSQMDPAVHIPPSWPARALLWMCSPDADAFIGQEISLRDEDIRRRVGLLQ